MAVIPDDEAFENVRRDYPDRSAAEKYQLAQADTLLRLTKAEDMDELNRMAELGLVDQLVEMHNQRMGDENRELREQVESKLHLMTDEHKAITENWLRLLDESETSS